jgi:phosphoribosylaminoimidazole (AIR) synthetase
MNSVKKLAQYEIIQYVETNQRIFPRQISYNISKNAIEVETIIKAIEQIGNIKTER